MPAPVEVQQDQDAAWAQRFRASPTNLAERSRREKQDEQIHSADYNERQAASAQNEQNLVRNKGARDLMFGRQRATLDARRQQLAEERLVHDKEKEDFMEERRLSAEESRIWKEKQEMKMTTQVDEQTKALAADVDFLLNDRGFEEGSSEYAQGVLQALGKYPRALKESREQYSKSARIKGDPDVLSKYAKENGLEMSGFRMDPQTGEMDPTFSRPRTGPKEKEPTPRDINKEISDTRKQWLNLVQREHALGDSDEALPLVREERATLESQLSALKKEASGLAGGVGAVASAPKSAVNQGEAAPQKKVFVDAAGNKAYQNEDGSYEPIP